MCFLLVGTTVFGLTTVTFLNENTLIHSFLSINSANKVKMVHENPVIFLSNN